MAEENKSCSLAVHLAMAALRWNEEMMLKLVDMSNQMNADYLFHDMLKEWVDFWLEWDALKAAREYTLKWQSVEMKFKALLFSWVLANTSQWDEALQAMFDAIKETWWSIVEWMDLLWLAAKMDLSQFEDVAKALWADVEAAKKFTEEVRQKISNYIASEYSVISTGTTVKPSKLKPKIEKRIAKATEYLDKEKESLWDAYKDVNKDLKRLQSKPKSTINYWSKKEWREELQKLQEKYKTKSASKREIEAKLSKIKSNEDIIKNWENDLKRIDDEYKAALEADLKVVKDNQNPFNYMWPDSEWKFNKEFNNNISNRVLEYWQYALARTLLTSDSVLPQSIYTSLVKLVKQYSWDWVSNTSWTKITEDWILDADRTLDELLAAAYINTKQLCDDWQLRMLYRQRLISLVSDWALSMDDASLVNTMMETLRFSWEWAGFSDILKYSILKDNATELLWRWTISLNGKELRDNIVNIFKRDDFDKLITSWDTVTLNDGSKITTRQLLELVTTMTNEVSLYKLIASNDFTDKQILDIAWEYLVWNAEEWRQKIINLVNVVRKNPTTDDTRWVVLKALTGKNVSKETPVWFFDFRRELNATDDVKARAEFRDRLAEANKIYIPDTGIRDLTTTNKSQLVKELEWFRWGYLLVTDSQWWLNKTLTSALDEINYKNWKLVDEKDRVVVIYPNKWLMGKVWFENGKLLFKTSYSWIYDTFLRKLAMRTLSDSWVDSTLSKEIINTIQYWWSTAEQNVDALMEFNKALEADAKKYFGAMIGEDPLSDRLPALLEQRTWISFKNYDAIMDKSEFRRMVDERFMLWMKLMWNYDQEVVTIADVIKQVDSMTPAEIASDLSSKYWFEIPEYRIADWNGKVRKEVRDAYLNYNLSETHIELLERKWKLLAVINGWVADNISITQFRSMWQNKNFSAYKDIFFHDLELADEELDKHIKAINDMIFEWLCLQFADNLVAMGYSLPLVNVRDLVYDFLNWKLNVNWDFARAFLYKNNLPDTLSTLSGIVNEAMPSELRFGYDDMVEELGYDKNKYRYIEWIRDWWYVENDEWIDAQVELAKKDFRNWRTIAEIAKAYLIPVEYMDEYLDLFHRSARARTSFMSNRQTWDIINTIILIRKELTEWTLSHELFHATFNFVPTRLRRNIVDEAMRLYWYDERTVNEMLADLFSDYFKTWKFELPRPKLWTTHSLLKYIKEAFESMKKWMLGVEKYEDKVRKLYDDILDLKYRPIDESELRELYGLTLDEAYEWETKRILSERWFDERITAEKRSRINDRWPDWKRRRFHKSDKINNFLRAREDAWTLNDEAFRIAQDMAYEWLWELSDEVDNLWRKLTNAQAMFGYVKNDDNKVQTFYHWTKAPLFDSFNLDYFRTWSWDSLIPWFYFATQKESKIMNNADEANRLIEVYLQARNPVDYKKTIWDLWTLDSLRNFIKEYHNYIWKEYDAKRREYKLEEWIKKDIRLKSFLGAALEYDWIFWNDVQTFLRYFKDNIWIDGIWDVPWEVLVVFTPEQIKYVTNERPTTDIRMFMREGYTANTPDQITRMIEVKNPFMMDTYSTLTAMAAIKGGRLMDNAWAERQVLKWILDDYYNAVKQATEWWKTLSFSEAQKLKTKAWYALDMFEQDYISPRYKQFLTPEEKSQLFWLKYTLWVATNSENLETIAEYNNKILDRYDNSVKNIIDTNNDIKSLISPNSNSINEEIEKRSKELIQQWATMKVVGWDVIVVDTREELLNQIRNMPSWVMWLEVYKTLWREWLNQLSNEQAYFLLQLVELARNADNKMNMISWTIYKLYPQLAKIDFFNTYKVVNWLPRILWWNLLESTDFLSSFTNTSTFDNNVKRDIFEEIKNAFAENWKLWYYKKKLWRKVYVNEYEHLQEIISSSIDSHVNDLANSIKGSDLKRFKKEAWYVYTNTFSPYTVLQDIPEATKTKIDEVLATQQKWIIEAMDLLWENNRLIDIMDSIYITTADWEIKSFRDILQWDEPNLSKILFDTDTNIIKSADETSIQKIDPTIPEKDRIAKEAENERIIKAQENNYNDALTAYLNNSEIVSQSERGLLSRLWGSARQVAKKYTLTNKLAETDNALAWLNESIIRWFKADILWFKWNVTAWWQLFWTRSITDNVMARWREVKELYRNLYSMSYNQLIKYSPKSELDEVALNLAKYFKEIERRCWSLDWITWATTKQEVNRAFAHLWEVILNINSIQWLFSLMSWVEWNQILKFFRFSEPWQLSRVNDLVIWNVWDYWVWWYRNYVDKTDEWLNKQWFNETFWANFTNDEYQKLIQALCWFTVVSKKMKWLMNTLNFINSSNYLTRVLLSYPWQFLTIANQTIAYFLKQKWWERELWAEDLWTIDKIRKASGILNWAYNELNLWEFFNKLFEKINPDSVDPNAYYNRYWIPDVDDLMSKEKFYTSDDITTLYSKIDNYGSDDKLISWSKFLRNTDAYKDNANNIIDWLFARNYKNIAFVKALQSNRYMTFATAEQFARFMASDAPWEMKQKLLDAVTSEAGRNFRNILWLGFSWLDRATWWGWLKNIFVALWQMFNFRWAWWQNIARQTSNWIITAIKMSRRWLSKEWRDAIAEYIAKQPEFINFTAQLFNDLHNMWRLVKYQDNWDYLPEWDEYSLMDFLEYSYETMQFSSQWWQWIQSYWTTRIITARAEWVAQSYKNPELYKDTLWVWALMNAISKNLWRNWKVADMFAKWVATAASNWWNWDVITEFLSNEFWKLSFWSLRYLMNEDETNYWYSTELINWGAWGIPFILSWESDIDWDKAYSYDMAWTETWLNLTNWRDAKQAWDTEAAREYLLNNIDSFYNSSQMFNFVRNIWRAVAGSDWIWDWLKWRLADGTIIWWRIYPMWSPFDLADVWETIAETDAWKQYMTYWKYIPTDVEDIKILMDEVIWQANHRPGNDWFNKSMFNFDESWHMKNLEESNEADASMELLLNNIKYERDSDYRFVLDKKWNRIVNPEREIHMQDMQNRFNDTNYMTESNFNFINSWVERNNDDPNYMLYKRLIAEWIAWRYADQQLQKEIDWYNQTFWLKWDYKVTKTKLQDSHKNYSEIYGRLPSVVSTITWEESSFLDSIITLDKAAAGRANIKMIERQLAEKWDTETIKKFFNIDKKWNINLSSRYESYIEEQAKLSKLLREEDLDWFIAETASITKMFKKEDPYGLATATLISSRIHRINQAENLSAEQKAKAIEALMADNYEFIQQHIPEMIDELGSNAKTYVDQMNNSIYDISLIWDLLTYENEKNNSKSWRSKSIKISGMAKDLLWKLGKSTWNGDWVGWWKQYNYNIVPVKLDWAKLIKATWGKWYTPKTASAAFEWYRPHVSFEIWKDINRNVKTTKTQTVSTSKQLSNIEKKTTKALEAES